MVFHRFFRIDRLTRDFRTGKSAFSSSNFGGLPYAGFLIMIRDLYYVTTLEESEMDSTEALYDMSAGW